VSVVSNPGGRSDLQIVLSEGKTSSIALSEQAKQLKMGTLYQQVIDAFLFSNV
jgi:hypothetical protein